MPEEHEQAEADVDPFVEDEQWLAALVRQLFRARSAGDAKAVEITHYYFRHRLRLTLERHLRKRDPVWNAPCPHGAYRWFDGLHAEPQYVSPGHLRLQGSICWVAQQEHWYYEPFEFEIELCASTGMFRKYAFRFGDHRPLTSKTTDVVPTIPVGGWAYVIERP